MFFFLIDAALAVGGVLLLIQQYQTGFQGAKQVGAGLARSLYKLIGTPTPAEQVDQVLGSLGRHTEAVRREVAKVRAYHQQFIESSAAHRTLAARYANAVNVALSRQEERLARAAAHKKIAHVKTAALFDGFAAALEKIIPTLDARLELTEDRHEAAKASAGILKAELAVATANEEVYQTLSGIEAETGIPLGAKLEGLRQQTRHQYLTSEHLLQLLPATPDAEIETFMKGIEVDEELDAARQQLSLPRPETSPRPDPSDRTS
jgi:phage shock protein A